MNEKLYLGCAKPPVHPQHLQIIDSTWTLIDLYVDDPSVIKMDARHLEYPDNSILKIYTSHLLEHFGIKYHILVNSNLGVWVDLDILYQDQLY